MPLSAGFPGVDQSVPKACRHFRHEPVQSPDLGDPQDRHQEQPEPDQEELDDLGEDRRHEAAERHVNAQRSTAETHMLTSQFHPRKVWSTRAIA